TPERPVGRGAIVNSVWWPFEASFGGSVPQPAYWRKCGQVEVTAAARWRVAGQANLTALQFYQFTVSRCCSFNGYRTRLRSIYPVVGCEFDILAKFMSL